MSSADDKAQALALLGSVDFSLEALEKDILNSSLTPQIFACFEDENSNLALEAAVCLKNLMTNENSGLGSKCTRRLYALCLLPVLSRLMEKLCKLKMVPASPVLVEAVAVQIMCISSVIPAALPQITGSSLVRLFASRQSNDSAAELVANCALLQAILVAVEDNKVMAEQLVALCPSLAQLNPSHSLLSVLQILCLLQCARSLPGVKPDLSSICNFLIDCLCASLPDAETIKNDPQSVKATFEVLELATEAFELLISLSPSQVGKLLKSSKAAQELFKLPFALANFWSTHFAAHFEGETNVDRVRLVRRLWSIISNMFTVAEQLMHQCRFVPSSIDFQEYLKDVIQVAFAAPEGDYSVTDELSGLIRARLVAWGDADYPDFTEDFFPAFKRLFLASESPIVLSNTCAMVALLIPYAPETVQVDFCVFLNAALCTEPFDVDHLEVLLSAVDAVTGIFDPQSKEWPAKPLSELKNDVLSAAQKLNDALGMADQDMKDAIKERVSTLKSFSRSL